MPAWAQEPRHARGGTPAGPLAAGCRSPILRLCEHNGRLSAAFSEAWQIYPANTIFSAGEAEAGSAGEQPGPGITGQTHPANTGDKTSSSAGDRTPPDLAQRDSAACSQVRGHACFEAGGAIQTQSSGRQLLSGDPANECLVVDPVLAATPDPVSGPVERLFCKRVPAPDLPAPPAPHKEIYRRT